MRNKPLFFLGYPVLVSFQGRVLLPFAQGDGGLFSSAVGKVLRRVRSRRFAPLSPSRNPVTVSQPFSRLFFFFPPPFVVDLSPKLGKDDSSLLTRRSGVFFDGSLFSLTLLTFPLVFKDSSFFSLPAARWLLLWWEINTFPSSDSLLRARFHTPRHQCDRTPSP